MSQYFWLLCGVWCGITGAVYARFQLRKHVALGEFSEAEVRSFTTGYALWIFIPCLVLWLLQRSIGDEAPPEYFKWSGPQWLAALGLQVFIWLALLYWVFLRGGANTLSRVFRATRPSTGRLYSPLVFKVGAVAAVFAGIGALLGGGA